MKILVHKTPYAICRLDAQSETPSWISSKEFHSISRSPNELSVVCTDVNIPNTVKSERGWRLLEVEGPLDFSMTGVLASIAQPLAQAQISIFAISTFDTDYLLVKDENLKNAVTCLQSHNFEVLERPQEND